MTPVSTASTYRVLPHDEIRVEGQEKVSGSAAYAADMRKDGMLWAAFVPAAAVHARIRAVDTSEALAMAGVRAVLTGADIPGKYLGRALLDWPVLAFDKVHFLGQYVAAVAADSRAIAEAAAQTIVVHYEELTPVFDPEEALAEGTPVLHEDRLKYKYMYGPTPTESHPNIQGRVEVRHGDVDKAFAEATHVFEHHFSTPRYHGGYIEPHATLVWIEPEGDVHVVTTNKFPGALKRALCMCDDIPPVKLIIEQSYIGGDFSAKGISIEEFGCYFLARATARPVKFVRTHLDDVRSTNTRHAAEITLKSGIDDSGKIIAFKLRVVYNGGAFAAAKPMPQLTPGLWTKTPYRLPNASAEYVSVYTNTIPAGHVRAPGDVQVSFAIESHIDIIAAALGIDPIDFRTRNAVGEGETDMDGLAYIEPRAREILEILRREGRWDEPLPAGRGKGIALSVRHIGHGHAQVQMLVHSDGAIDIHTPIMDQGGGQLTMMMRVTAEAIGIDTRWLRFVRETSTSRFAESGPGASRVTHITGRACQQAGEAIKARLTEHGWDGSASGYSAAAKRASGSAGCFEIVGDYKYEVSLSERPKPGEAHAHKFSGYLIDLSVDRETGTIEIHDALLVSDVGAIINPLAHQGQLDGGFVFGLGTALTEELVVEEGRIVNLTFADYKIPTQRDIPPLRTVLLETPGGPGPFGAKASGETSTAAVAPAIANAIARACGARLTRLPITAERVLDALRDDR